MSLKLVDKCISNIYEFNDRFFYYSCQLYNLQVVMDPKQLCKSLIVAFGKAETLRDDSKHHSWKYMKCNFRAWRMKENGNHIQLLIIYGIIVRHGFVMKEWVVPYVNDLLCLNKNLSFRFMKLQHLLVKLL